MARFMEYARTYQSRFRAAVDGWDLAAAERIAEVLLKARQEGRHVLVAGNGGSAAISNHFECDASKGTHVHGCPPLRTRSLAANASVLTALGNDVGFESIFDRQVDYYAQPGDVVILVSSSGNSPNVVRACRRAKELGLTTVALVGFGGGKLKELADHALHVPVDNYGVAEDMHQATVHLVTQFLYDLWKTECAAAPPDPAPVPVPAPLVVAAGAEVLPGEGARPTGAAWAPPVPVPALAGEDTVPSSAGGTTGELPDPVAPGAVPGEVPPPPPLSPVAPSTPVEVQQGVVRRAGGGWWRRRAREVSYLVQVAAWLAWTAGRSLGGGLAGWGAALAASERAATWAARLMALGTVVGAALIARFTLWGFPNSADEQDYLWISERLLEGRLSIPAPKIWPVVEFWWRMVKDGRELAQYPATWPAVMVPFVALGVPWLTGSVVAGVGVLLVYRLCREAYGSRATGLVAAFLLGTNAMFLMNAASFFPHTLCQTLGVAGLLLLWRSVFSETPRAPFMAGLWPGLVAGVCASVRPPDAVASLGVAALVAGLVAVRRPKWTGWWVLGGLTGAVVGILPLLLHNRWATGHFLRTAYQLFDSRYDGITFQWSYWMSRWSVVE
jgi:phosphoheptose isomerase